MLLERAACPDAANVKNALVFEIDFRVVPKSAPEMKLSTTFMFDARGDRLHRLDNSRRQGVIF